MMLAIIIPYYKLTFLEATLKSLANQTDKRFKVYIGDDASPESPIRLLEKYEEGFDGRYHRFENNLGRSSLTRQWHRCISLAMDEEWVMLLGDDDVLGENAVAEFYRNLPEIESKSINVIRYATQIIDESGIATSGVYQHPKIENSIDFIIKKSSNQTRSSLSEYVFKKAKVLQIGFKEFPLAWYSDDLAVLEFSEFKNVLAINESVVLVRFSALSISGSPDTLRKKLNSRFEFYYFLLSNKQAMFSKPQRDFFFFKLSNCYINEKRQFHYFLRITWLSLSNGMFQLYFNFLKRVIANSKKK